ncbi:MAG: PH domain-containing protein [Candidatus Tisiphia sp.]
MRYEDIKEITLKQNFIQKWFELGIISMTTNASIEGAGINFFNLNPMKFTS